MIVFAKGSELLCKGSITVQLTSSLTSLDSTKQVNLLKIAVESKLEVSKSIYKLCYLAKSYKQCDQIGRFFALWATF